MRREEARTAFVIHCQRSQTQEPGAEMKESLCLKEIILLPKGCPCGVCSCMLIWPMITLKENIISGGHKCSLV